MRVFAACLIVAAAVGAFAFRIPRLEQRPMHTDEAVHTVKAGILIEQGKYTYDPHEYHGPTIYYAALPFIWASGAKTLADTSEWEFRIVPVVFGVGLILLLLLVLDGLGPWACIIAAVLTAISPAMVFYSRYYIQEIPFTFFSFCAITAGWRYSRSQRIGWALFCGLSLGLMLATKETSIISYAAMGGGLAATLVWERIRRGPGLRIRDIARPWHVAAGALVGLVACTTVVSGFFTNPRGALDIFLTFRNYVGRAGGAGMHDHPWNYYFKILLGIGNEPGPKWNEKLIVVLAVIGAFAAIAGALKHWINSRSQGAGMQAAPPESGDSESVAQSPTQSGADAGADAGAAGLLLFLTIYTALLAAAYCVIPYKTPWCMLTFLHGMILLAGVGFAGVMHFVKNNGLRAVFALAIVLAAYRMGLLAYQASYRFYADARNPYVYGHTATDFLRLVKRVEEITPLTPEKRGTLIKVVSPDPWPLPWYLRKYPNVGYWQAPIDDMDAALVIAAKDIESGVESRLHDAYQSEYYGQRPEVLMRLFIRKDLWDAFIKTR